MSDDRTVTAASSPAAVALAEVRRRLALFAQGLIGEAVELLDLDGRGADNGAPAEGDALVAIRLPVTIDVFSSTRGNLDAYRVAVLRGIGRHEFGPTCAAARGSAEGTGVGALRAWLVEVLEARRIDAAIARRYLGAATSMEVIRAEQRRDRTSASTDPWSFALASIVAASLGAAEQDLLADPLATPLLGRALEAARVVEAPAADLTTSMEAADVLARLLRELRGPTGEPDATDAVLVSFDDADLSADPTDPVDQHDQPFQQDQHDQHDQHDQQDPDHRPDPLEQFELEELTSTLRAELGIDVDLPDDLLPELADHRLGGGAVDVDVRVPDLLPHVERVDLADDREATPRRAQAPWAASAPADGDGARRYRYDEWSYLTNRYLPDWCTLYERRLRGEELDYLDQLRRRHGDVAARVRRYFAFARPHAFQRIRHVDDGDELDLDAVVEAFVDRRAGRIGDDRHHVRRHRARRDVAAAFLIDMSSSTSTPVPDKHAPPPPPPPVVDESLGPYLRGSYWDDPEDWPPPPAGPSVLDLAKSAMAIVGLGLEQLGDAYAVYGFSGRGRDNVEFHVGKEFTDTPSARTWAAVAAMRPLGYTRMGPAIRHATTKLAAQPETTKLLVVLSDGYPQDQDYGPDWRDHDYGLHDTARALREAASIGVSTFCITVDPAGHDYLRRMCDRDRYLVIEELEDLPRELARVYRTLSGLGAG